MSRKKLDSAEECLSACLPRDVASSVKQFFRELPEPVLPTEMQVALLKEHHLPTEKGRTCATMLLSCILPDTNQSVIGYFAEFLQKVSKRSAKKKMDRRNLSFVLAPTLLQTGGVTEINSNTEKGLQMESDVPSLLH
ncbi:inactive Rho GTPase-activating protein 11B-like isoform X2 [Hippocampus zosterae]|uniref:inactive Rho GTPase-activating protein 11B-like isoform X2 n=1 Tax=Hippocampus zosterae TaxID=109293 RepID=UPI00223D80B1|nr:inactive Rho GTPase-activating protein 11B-like isoform X2 [Hippocampus zosterae]